MNYKYLKSCVASIDHIDDVKQVLLILIKELEDDYWASVE